MSSLFGIGAGSASTGFYPFEIGQSIRITNNGYLNMSTNGFANAPTLTTKGTLSFWIKVLDNDDRNYVFMNYSANNNNGLMYIQVGSANDGYLTIPQYGRVPYLNGIIQRDFSNWYHFVVSFDSTSSNASERLMKIYQNGTQVTTGTFNAINQNDVFPFTAQGSTNGGFTIGRHATVGYYTECILAEINLIDGQSLDASYFGEFKGIWIPKEYTGTYGNNGCRFTFASSDFNTSGSSISDPNGSSVDLFNNGISDASGNGNHLNLNSVSTHDILLDSPTNNFSTWNALFRGGEKSSSIYASSTLSEGNLKVSVPTNSYMGNTFRPTSGKWYMEMRVTTVGSSNLEIDWGWIQATEYSGNTGHAGQANKWGAFAYQTHIRLYDETSQLGSNISVTVSAGDILQLAWDIDNNKGWVGINNTWYRTDASDGNPSAGTNEAFTFTDDEAQNLQCYIANGTSTDVHVANFGQDDTFAGAISSSGNTDSSGAVFKYTPPTDFLALCSKNITDTTISPNQETQADDHFNTVLYTGNGSSGHAITGVGFQPDWVWIKGRSGATNHGLHDSSRVISGNEAILYSNATNAESTGGAYLSSFDSDGFTVNNNTSGNNSSDTYVAWNWKAGGTTPTKTYKVVVVSDSGNKYRFRNSADSATFAQSAVTLDLQEGGTYVFDWSDSTAQGHPIRFSTTSDGTHGGGSEYTTGVVKDDSAYTTTITVASSAPQLYYYCSIHSGMGGSVSTNSTFGSTNFDGSILSVEQANTEAGFSIITYTGTGVAGTIGHGLGKTPALLLTKNRSWSHEYSAWLLWHHKRSNAFNASTNYAYLHLTTTGGTSTTSFYRGDQINTTTYGIYTNDAINDASYNYVCYAFAEIEGYSKIGSYTGNGSTDGTFVYTGFRPAWIMVKRTNASGHWLIFDNKRNGFNPDLKELKADSSSAETDFDRADLVSNGFKHRTDFTDNNGSGSTYIYMAFAEMPFKFSNAR